jgi:drug/metabolite transporter (DMT)-like permease
LHVLLVGRVADRMSAPFLVAGGQFAVFGLLALPWSLAYTGILSVGVAFTAQVVAQRYAHTTDAAIVLSAETLFAAMFGYLLMGDQLDATGLAGCGLIFVSMMAIQLLPMLTPSVRASGSIHGAG